MKHIGMDSQYRKGPKERQISDIMINYAAYLNGFLTLRLHVPANQDFTLLLPTKYVIIWNHAYHIYIQGYVN